MLDALLVSSQHIPEGFWDSPVRRGDVGSRLGPGDAGRIGGGHPVSPLVILEGHQALLAGAGQMIKEDLETLDFHKKHSYLTSDVGIEAPVSLMAGAGVIVRLLAKVDTGATFCIFQREYGEQIGLEVESGIREIIRTAAGSFETFGHTVTLACFDWTFENRRLFRIRSGILSKCFRPSGLVTKLSGRNHRPRLRSAAEPL